MRPSPSAPIATEVSVPTNVAPSRVVTVAAVQATFEQCATLSPLFTLSKKLIKPMPSTPIAADVYSPTNPALSRVVRTNTGRSAPGPGGPGGPAGPCGPCGPGSPWGPCGPVGPCGPGSPWGPCGPWGPVGPCGPVAPGFPCGPAGPCAPAAPRQSRTSTTRSPFASSVARSAMPFPFRSQQLAPSSPSVPFAPLAPSAPGAPAIPAGPGSANDSTRAITARRTATTLSPLLTPDPREGGDAGPPLPSDAMRRAWPSGGYESSPGHALARFGKRCPERWRVRLAAEYPFVPDAGDAA